MYWDLDFNLCKLAMSITYKACIEKWPLVPYYKINQSYPVETFTFNVKVGLIKPTLKGSTTLKYKTPSR